MNRKRYLTEGGMTKAWFSVNPLTTLLVFC